MELDITRTISDYIFMNDTPRPSDIIFLPGNGYQEMAENAARLYHAGFAPYILPSGKFSITKGRFGGVLSESSIYAANPYETEWAFLSDVLINNGVPKSAILKEDQASYTYENALFSKHAADMAGLCIKRAILCCKNYHARRAWMYYHTVFPEADILVCPSQVDDITKENWTGSEKGIHEVMAELNRVIVQFSLMM